MTHERLDDMPAPFRWIMIFIKQVGFPIVVCVWLAYQQFVSGRETVHALQEFKEVMIKVNATLEQQNKLLRHRNKLDE